MLTARWHPRTGAHLLVLDAGLAAVVTAAYLTMARQDGSDGIPSFTGPWWLRARAARRDRRLEEDALTEERLRIARELHDLVSNTPGVIVVKAAVAGHMADERPEETGDAPRVIEQTGREALTDMRRALGVLRGDAEYPHLSNGTVKTHIGRLLNELRARDRAQLVISAYEAGLVRAAS